MVGALHSFSILFKQLSLVLPERVGQVFLRPSHFRFVSSSTVSIGVLLNAPVAISPTESTAEVMPLPIIPKGSDMKSVTPEVIPSVISVLLDEYEDDVVVIVPSSPTVVIDPPPEIVP